MQLDGFSRVWRCISANLLEVDKWFCSHNYAVLYGQKHFIICIQYCFVSCCQIRHVEVFELQLTIWKPLLLLAIRPTTQGFVLIYHRFAVSPAGSLFNLGFLFLQGCCLNKARHCSSSAIDPLWLFSTSPGLIPA